MLNQKQPDYNTFVKELAQGLLFPLQNRGCIGAVPGIVVPNADFAFRRMWAL